MGWTDPTRYRAGTQATTVHTQQQPQRETMATSASNAKTNKRNMHNDANKSDAGSKTNNQQSSGTDAASQEMFEKMFRSSERSWAARCLSTSPVVNSSSAHSSSRRSRTF